MKGLASALLFVALITFAGCSKCTTCNKRVYQYVNHGPPVLIWQASETPDAAIKLCGGDRVTKRTYDTTYPGPNIVIKETNLICNY